ncbi:helix-turn-helix domain-containing protein [Sphingomonas rubra]|uniref:DNA binding domain-containing protein, excisionase family n=1 Tax=Sphingomonas rubra TaxID=634430 RepID=A0A1I5PHP0_9SPHN|nr:helix-turn-helix domain-containing protein [Sphingomonas rubra]SFP33367.1 DNA binding domain-containing protein, excisionase family [Sphingomonas rubra]
MPNVETKKGRPEPAHSPLEPLAVRIPTAMQLIGVRRSTVYALIKAGELQTVKLGRATLITMSSLRRLVECP